MEPASQSQAATMSIHRRDTYPADDLGFLKRTHPLRGRPFGQLVYVADSVMLPMDRPGFGMHPHVNVDVVSYVVDGELTHRDSAGNVGIVPAGGFQRITAGTGIQHDESNRTGSALRMFQIWFASRLVDVVPDYATIETAGTVPNGSFRTVIGDAPGALGINADAAISLGRLEARASLTIDVHSGRAALLYLVEGVVEVGGQRVARQDQVRIIGPGRLEVGGVETADLMLIESGI